jgi:hydroxymethylglutaryl-CoA synthase
MVGIESYGTALPALRLPAAAYVAAWGRCSARGLQRKAFCAYDEDAVTLGIEAARRALARAGGAAGIDAIFFGCTTPPYDEKPSAATLATALFEATALRVTEISGSPQAGLQALISALEFCAANGDKRALAVAADAPSAPADAPYEHGLGAAAAAFVVGAGAGAATLAASFAVTRETFGSRFRRHGGSQMTDLELRSRDSLAALQALGRTLELPKVKRIAMGADAGLMRGAARALGFADAILDDQWSRVGDAGAASATLALAAALDASRAGDTILCVAVGAGATAGAFTAGKGLARLRRKGAKVADQIDAGREVDYVSYLKHRRVLSSRFGGTG